MDPMRKKALGRSQPQRGKTKKIKRTVQLLKRQSQSPILRAVPSFPYILTSEDKVWLETHIWHAKRMKMENMWGYRLVSIHVVCNSVITELYIYQAVQPTEKAFRPSHRASVHGSILHDASYFGFLQLSGPEAVLCSIFDRSCDPQGPSPHAKR